MWLCFWSITDPQHYVSFRCPQSDSTFPYKTSTLISRASICHYTKLLHDYWLYSPCCARFLFFFNIVLFWAALGLWCCARAFSSCAVQASHGSGFPCGARALGAQASVVATCGLSSGGTGLAVLWHMEPSQARDQTRVSWVSCIGRQNSIPLCHLGSLRQLYTEGCESLVMGKNILGFRWWVSFSRLNFYRFLWLCICWVLCFFAGTLL